MSTNNDLIKLKKLQKDLQAIDAVNKSIAASQSQIDRYKEECYKRNPLPEKLNTNNAQQYRDAIMASKKEKAENSSDSLKGAIIAVSIIAMVIAIICYIVNIVNYQSGYLYTPEIVKEYVGVYQNDSKILEEKFTITSCDKKGNIEGVYEYSAEGELLGKFNFEGEITRKNKNGAVDVDIHNSGWITEENEVDPFYDLMYIYITDNYTAIYSSDQYTDNVTAPSDLRFYAVDSKANEPVTNLATPEIVRSYEGYFKESYYGRAYYSKMTIESCDENGNIIGIFEGGIPSMYEEGTQNYEEEKNENYAKYEITGKVKQKYASGRVIIEITRGNIVEQLGGFELPETLEFEIFDNYQALKDKVYDMEWLDNNQYKSKRPITKDESAKRKTIGLIIFIIPVLGFILSIIVNRKKKTSSITMSQTEIDRIKELEAKDRENEKANADYQKRLKAVEDKRYYEVLEYKQKLLAEPNDTLNKLCKEVDDNDVLSNKDKNLDVLNYIIDLIESRRADSVKEALKDYDAYVKEHDKRLLEEFNRRQDEIVRKYQAQQEAEDYMNQMFQRQKMKQALDKQNDELERIRKELERR